MNIKNYINRIKYTGEITPNMVLLLQLQKAHLLSIPFENLDIHYGNKIDLDVAKIYAKVVEKGRGGFCYELNGLFFFLLKTIGFDAKIVSANVYNNDKKEFGKAFDHLTIIVKLNDIEYLVDVGFGEFTFFPLKLELNTIQTDSRGDFMIEMFEKGVYQVLKLSEGKKIIQYIFTIQEKVMNQFTEMCQYHQTSPDSHFTHQKLISRPTENGRITLAGNILKITDKGAIKKEVEFEKSEFEKYLLDWFNIDAASINTDGII
ncbi:MAG: acetyltransferase [Crocinitomix sp.]|nr:acetyltransferase [Crocinitomix sp.]